MQFKDLTHTTSAWAAAVFAILVTLAPASEALAQSAICYNCPPEWADWGTQLKLIKEKTGITVPPDNKNSGQIVVAAGRRKGEPGGRCHLLRRDLRHSGEERRRGHRLQTRRLGRHSRTA